MGSDDLPKRASSPLKRPATELEADDDSNQKDDVDMVEVPDSPDHAKASVRPRAARSQSVNMLENEPEPNEPVEPNSVRPKSPSSEIPPIDAQIKTVTAIVQAAAETQPSANDKVFLVSKRWLNRVISRGSEALKHSKVAPEGEIGPVDNSDIIQQIIKDHEGADFVQLKQGLGGEDFELFPEDAWNLVVEWYGIMPGSIPITRFAHNTNPDRFSLPNIQFEFHPLILKVHRLYSDHSGINLPQILKATNPPAPILIASRSGKYYDFLKKAKTVTQIDHSKKVRIWRVPRIQPAAEPTAPAGSVETPPASRPGTPSGNGPVAIVVKGPQDSWTQLLLDVVSFTKLEKGNGRELVEGKDISADPNYNGSADLSQNGIGDNETIVLDELVNTKDYVSTYNGSKAITRFGGAVSQPNSGRTSPAPSGPLTRGRAKNGRERGTVGLSNLGNTCYMNSALQCVRSVEELTKYFLNGTWKGEVNYDNPLGKHGEIAHAYQRLLEEIYKEPTPTSVAPRPFKNTIGKFAPSFSGYGQQDSQEFLGFLLDGLQEDLNRILNKPYIEKPDSTDEMIGNPAAIKEMAAKVWDITKQRDDSVIADLFTGMYKSTLVCPVCEKVSITFDPFNTLTLQLPIESTWTHTIQFFPLNDVPLNINVDMSKQGSILNLKQFVSSRTGVPVERLFAAEEFKNKFYKIYLNTDTASEAIGSNDKCWIYELEDKPTNWPPIAKKTKNSLDTDYVIPKWDDPAAEKMVVPVFHRRPVKGSPRYQKSRAVWSIANFSHFILLTPEEAMSEDIIRRKILEKVATLSTYAELHEDDDESAMSGSGSIDPDLVVTNGSDADSSGGTKVQANSIDGDSDLVNVTKQSKAETEPSQKPENMSTKPLTTSIFNTRRPKFIDPKSYLNPSLQGLFDISYLPPGTDVIQTGWQSLNDDRAYEPISSRVPQLPDRDGSESIGSGSSRRRGSESSEGDDSYQSGGAPTRMMEESDEDEEPRGLRKVLPVRPAAASYRGSGTGLTKRQRKRQLKTYSKKGSRPTHRKFQESTPEPDNYGNDTSDDGPLIRPGEALIVNWREDAYETVYEGERDDHMRGHNTWEDAKTLDDPELAAKKAFRAARRRNGVTLEDCLDEFGKDEILSEMDMWYCPRCKEHQRASKKLELWKTPDILVVHLKRFSSNAFRRDKLDVMVDFPLEDLDLTTRVMEKEDGKVEVYDLFAVDDHWGGLGGGHYTAFAKNFFDNEWYEYNDSSVSKVKDPSRVVSQSAYLLFYRRRSDGPLGGPRFKQIVEEFDRSTAPSSADEGDESESGEGKGLVVSSYPHGSSSPFKGAGATLLPKGGLGAKSPTGTVNPASLEQLPDYSAHEAASNNPQALLSGAATSAGLHPSIEEDEGIDMDSRSNSVQNFIQYDPNVPRNPVRQDWGWSAINNESSNDFSSLNRNTRGNMISGIGSDADADYASDAVDDNSSASASSRRNRLLDFDTADDGGFEDPSPVPDMSEDDMASGIALQHEILEQNLGWVGPIGQREDEEEGEAMEIHIDDADEIKVD